MAGGDFLKDSILCYLMFKFILSIVSGNVTLLLMVKTQTLGVWEP